MAFYGLRGQNRPRRPNFILIRCSHDQEGLVFQIWCEYLNFLQSYEWKGLWFWLFGPYFSLRGHNWPRRPDLIFLRYRHDQERLVVQIWCLFRNFSKRYDRKGLEFLFSGPFFGLGGRNWPRRPNFFNTKSWYGYKWHVCQIWFDYLYGFLSYKEKLFVFFFLKGLFLVLKSLLRSL